MKISFDIYIYILEVDCCPIFNKFMLLHTHHIMKMEFEQRWPTTNINTMNNHFWHQIMEQTKTYRRKSMSCLRTRIKCGGFIQMWNFICWSIFNFCDIFLYRIKWRTREPNRQEVSYLSKNIINFGVFRSLYKSLIDWVRICGCI
jgi:hypothetical protein